MVDDFTNISTYVTFDQIVQIQKNVLSEDINLEQVPK